MNTLPALTGVRFVAALLVLLYHFVRVPDAFPWLNNLVLLFAFDWVLPQLPQRGMLWGIPGRWLYRVAPIYNFPMFLTGVVLSRVFLLTDTPEAPSLPRSRQSRVERCLLCGLGADAGLLRLRLVAQGGATNYRSLGCPVRRAHLPACARLRSPGGPSEPATAHACGQRELRALPATGAAKDVAAAVLFQGLRPTGRAIIRLLPSPHRDRRRCVRARSSLLRGSSAEATEGLLDEAHSACGSGRRARERTAVMSRGFIVAEHHRQQ